MGFAGRTRLRRCDLVGLRHEQEQGIGERTMVSRKNEVLTSSYKTIDAWRTEREISSRPREGTQMARQMFSTQTG